MAGQGIEGYLWGQSLGLDLLPPIAIAGFRTLSLASVQNLGSSLRDPRSTKLALESRSSITPTQVDPCIKMDVLREI
jgi:hypothetical protein